MAIKILFIDPSLPYDNPVFEHEIPIHLVYLANFLMEKMYPKPEIEFLDLEWERKMDKAFDPFNIMRIERLIMSTIDHAFNFRREDRFFVLVSCFFTYQYLSSKKVLEAIQNLRKSNSIDVFKVIVGGYHPTILPGDFNDLGVDCVIRGEGEIALLDLLSRNGNVSSHTEIIEGSIVRDLDMLPPVDFSVYKKYVPYYKHLSITLSRGCPFNCNFCIEKKYKAFKCEKAAWREYSPDRAKIEIRNVIKASESMLNGRDKQIGFYDPIFGFNERWLRGVLEFLREENYGYHFWAETRIDSFKKDSITAMKAANISLMLGLESGSPKMLHLMNKTKDPKGFLNKLECILNRSKEINYGPFVLNLMFNFPGENPKTLGETFTYLDRLINDCGNFTAGSNFYNFFPGDAIFSDTGTWEKEHGTKIYFKEWWKSQETATAGHILDASRDLTIRDSITRVHDGMKAFFESVIMNETSLAKKLFVANKMAFEGKIFKNWLLTIDKLLNYNAH
nr:cobalamin-dependent protein [Candidatus Sigynarchaeum springense]MDO8119657.1 cobalamin-dependent protein [Candidatus Sigynarchaeota archaeon]